MTDREEIVRANLIEVARRRSTITYGEAAKQVGMTAIGIGPHILDPINEYEHARGRPLLSAVVVGKSSRRPGRGFYALASRLGLYKGDDDEGYWQRETQAIYSTWAE